MSLIPVPSGRNAVRLAAIVVMLTIVVLVSPALVVGWVFNAGRDFVLQLVRELRAWTLVILGTDQARVAPLDDVTPGIRGDPG